jgi:hypothetical protein
MSTKSMGMKSAVLAWFYKASEAWNKKEWPTRGVVQNLLDAIHERNEVLLESILRERTWTLSERECDQVFSKATDWLTLEEGELARMRNRLLELPEFRAAVVSTQKDGAPQSRAACATRFDAVVSTQKDGAPQRMDQRKAENLFAKACESTQRGREFKMWVRAISWTAKEMEENVISMIAAMGQRTVPDVWPTDDESERDRSIFIHKELSRATGNFDIHRCHERNDHGDKYTTTLCLAVGNLRFDRRGEETTVGMLVGWVRDHLLRERALRETPETKIKVKPKIL